MDYKYTRFLEFEGLQDQWYRYLQLACKQEKDINLFQTARDDGVLNPDGTWEENSIVIFNMFSPLCTRGQALKKLIEVHPDSGETLADYIARFKLCKVDQTDIDDWVHAELFVLSLPDWLRTVLHRSDLDVTSYDSLEEVITRVKKIVADAPQRPLISSGQQQQLKKSYHDKRPDRNIKFPPSNESQIKRQRIDGEDQNCSRCHRSGHRRSECFATTMVDGKPLTDKAPVSKPQPSIQKNRSDGETSNNNFSRGKPNIGSVGKIPQKVMQLVKKWWMSSPQAKI